MYGAWKDEYLDYNGLKTDLKKRTARRPWNAKDEHDFTQKLERELEKIYNFQKNKVSFGGILAAGRNDLHQADT